MQRIFTLTLFACFFACAATAQYGYTRYIIQFKDKKGTQYTLANPSAYLSQKAIDRRTRQKLIVDSTDLPISKDYLDSIRAVPNVTILNQSKWLNQILVRTADPLAVTKINSFLFVKSFLQIAPAARRTEDIVSSKLEPLFDLDKEIISGANGVQLDYGSTLNQIQIHKGDYLHDLGFTGKGITIAILDAGFRSYLTNPAFDSVRLQGRVLGTWDYVNNEASVNEDDLHGASCFSIIASNRPGIIVGSAPGASFYLLRTEDVFSEYPVEEQNWAAAAEFADSAGVDMISTSLGYNMFDNPAFNHTYPQRDGNTSIVTRAADLAAHKGILVTVSAGNDGGRSDEYKFVSCPADADSVLTVGAVTNTGVIANFSCWGPNYAGRIKPNVVSVGQGTIIANTSGNPVSGNGTSFSNPNMAGLVACLWQAFPEFTNMEIIDAVQKSADRYSTPDVRYGYGIPDFHKAYDILSAERQLRKYATILGNEWIKAFPVPYDSYFNVLLKAQTDGQATLQLTDGSGRIIESKTVSTIKDNSYLISFSHSHMLASGVYFIRYNDGKNKTTLRVIKQ